MNVTERERERELFFQFERNKCNIRERKVGSKPNLSRASCMHSWSCMQILGLYFKLFKAIINSAL